MRSAKKKARLDSAVHSRQAERAEARRKAEAERRKERSKAARKAEAVRKAKAEAKKAESKAKRLAEAKKAESKAKRLAAAEAKRVAMEARRRAAVRARLAGLLRRFGGRAAFQALKARVLEDLQVHRRAQLRAKARRAFGALVRRRMAAFARVQQLLRRLGGRHKWRQAAMAELRARKAERRALEVRRLARIALRMFSRFVHSAGARKVSITVQPFAYMRSKGDDGPVMQLRANYRGHKYMQDRKGRYHQQLSEKTFNAPMVATFGLQDSVVMWLQSEEGSPVFHQDLLVADRLSSILDVLSSSITAVRFTEITEVHPHAAYNALQVVNHGTKRGTTFAYSKYASATPRPAAATLDDWLQPPASASDVCLVDACAYDLLLRVYKAPIEALQRPDSSRRDHKGGRYQDLSMTYEGLWTFFHGDRPFDPTQMGLTVLQFRTFFERMSLQLTVVDITGASILEACHTPERQNRKLNPHHVWVLLHDEHLLQLTSGLNSLSKLPRSVLSGPLSALSEVVHADNKPSAHFYIPRKDAQVTFIERLDDLMGLDFSGPEQVMRVACPLEMPLALYQLVTRCSYLPGVRMHGGKISALKLRLHNKDVYLSAPDCVPNDRTVMLETKAEFDLYHRLDKQLAASLMSCEGKSAYSKDVGKCFRELLRSPLCFGTGADANKFGNSFGAGYNKVASECSVHDLSKAHTAALLEMECFPVFNEFDRFKPYAGGAINPNALYIVRRTAPIALTDPRFLLLNEEVNLVTAQSVLLFKDWPGVCIESVLEPSKLVSAKDTHSAIRAIWDSELAVEHKKFLVNKAVGMVGRRYNAMEYAYLFRTEAEAAHFARTLKAQLLVRKISDEVFYLVHKEEKAELVDGFFPIQHCVYDWVRIQLYKRALEVGRPLLAVKTDALVFAGLEHEVKKEHTFAGIGRWGVSSEMKRQPTDAPAARKSTFVPAATASVPVTVLSMADEFDAAEMGALLAANNHMLLLGDLPGVGKSEAPKRHCAKATTLFVLPANKLRASISKEGHNAVTLHTLLGVRVEGESVAPMDISRYSTVVFDEIFAHPVGMLARIGSFMRNNAMAGAEPRKFYAAGDPKQNPPIEQLCVADTMAYYMDAVSMLFPTQLTLCVCKRVSNPAEQARLLEIKEALFTTKESPAAVLLKYAKHVRDLKDIKGTAICYLNSTASAINHYLHSKASEGRTDLLCIGGNSYYRGLELVCRKRQEAYFANESGEYMKRGVLQVNFTYTVLEASEEALVLDDLEGGRVRITHAQALQHFSYSHAFTGHAQQGMSVGGPITIFDYSFSSSHDGVACGIGANWVYTALSRARNMQEVYVYVGTLGSAVSAQEFEIAMERKIFGYKAADRKAGRTWVEEEFVTPADIKGMLRAQSGRCGGCGCVLQQQWIKGDHE